MQFKVTDVEFDFEDEFGELTEYDCNDVIAETLETTWEADDELDLLEEITVTTGWCIKSIDYQRILC